MSKVLPILIYEYASELLTYRVNKLFLFVFLMLKKPQRAQKFLKQLKYYKRENIAEDLKKRGVFVAKKKKTR